MYDEAFKQRVIAAVRDRSDEKSITDVANEYNISPRTLYSWLDRQSHYKKRARPRVANPCRGEDHAGDTATTYGSKVPQGHADPSGVASRKRVEELEQENANLRSLIDILVEAIRKATRP